MFLGGVNHYECRVMVRRLEIDLCELYMSGSLTSSIPRPRQVCALTLMWWTFRVVNWNDVDEEATNLLIGVRIRRA